MSWAGGIEESLEETREGAEEEQGAISSSMGVGTCDFLNFEASTFFEI